MIDVVSSIIEIIFEWQDSDIMLKEIEKQSIVVLKKNIKTQFHSYLIK
jgi:hypothetical protein